MLLILDSKQSCLLTHSPWLLLPSSIPQPWTDCSYVETGLIGIWGHCSTFSRQRHICGIPLDQRGTWRPRGHQRTHLGVRCRLLGKSRWHHCCSTQRSSGGYCSLVIYLSLSLSVTHLPIYMSDIVSHKISIKYWNVILSEWHLVWAWRPAVSIVFLKFFLLARRFFWGCCSFEYNYSM